MQELVIQPGEGSKKGRSFQAVCVAVMTANALFPEANGKTIRPVWAMFAGSESELRPFMANLRLGRKAEPSIASYRKQGDGERVEFLKTVGFTIGWQRETEGTLATIFHPGLFRLDPGMVDPAGISFVMLVPNEWADAQKLDPEAAVAYVKTLGFPVTDEVLTALVPTAYLFAAYLDRRTRCPLVPDGRFYLQLLCASLTAGIASFPGTDVKHSYGHRDEWGHNKRHGFNFSFGGYSNYRGDPGYEALNIRHAISCMVNHEDFEAFLAEQVTEFYARTDGDGEFTSLGKLLDLSSLV